MEVRCHACGKVQQYAEEDLGNRRSHFLQCAACGQMIRVVNPKLETLRPETTRQKAPVLSEEVSPEGRKLRLSEDRELSLKVLEGEEKGTVYPLAKPRTLIGRANADILLSDPLASRLHCALEVGDDGVLLRDLSSTNGTLVNDQPIVTSTLVSGSTFRVGAHLFQLLINPKSA